MITTTGRDLVTTALVTLQAWAPGESIPNELLSFGLNRMNAMIDGWELQRQTSFKITRSTYPLVAGTQNYTIGVGGTFNQARPTYIDGAAYLVPGSSPDVEIGVAVLTDEQYEAQSIKGLTAPLIGWIYYDSSNVAGLGTIIVWPVPTQAQTLVLYCPTPVAQMDLSTSVRLTPGYERAIVYNLCRELYLAVGRPFTPDLNMLAVDSLGDIKRANYQSNDLGFDLGMVRQTGKYAYNINSDQP
jgi:hypothetical protein